jgi:CHAD domain-containing protein
MATTTPTNDGSKVTDVPAFAEHDKLGPLGGKQAVLGNENELRQILVSEFAAAAAAAREAAGSVDRGAATAVHAYRKALRRARAVLSLVARALPKSERRAVRRALREARRALSSSRDHTVAPDALGQLPLGEVERATAKAIVDAAAEAMPPITEIKQLLAEGAARAAAQVEALEAALPPAIAWSDVERGVRGIYDDARRARKSAKRSKRAFHTWRRRSKELTYQLELIAGYAGPHVSELFREVEGATDPQSPAVDLIMLRDFIRTYGQGVDAEAYDFLLAAIDGQLDDLMKSARRAGKAAFGRSPRRFVRRLRKAVKRDQEPATPADEHVTD